MAVQYNLLNLPYIVQFADGNQIVNHYDALGNRYRTTYHTRKVPVEVPLSTILSGTGNLLLYSITTHATSGNLRYESSDNGPLRLGYVFNSEGYFRYSDDGGYSPFYYIKDHLGSIRETYSYDVDSGRQCVQRMQYYPSGLPWDSNYNASEQPYKYNGKEFVEMSGLNEYDSQARWYYTSICRTTTIDPLAEQYYDISPYAWCGNNPVGFVDLDGMMPKWSDELGGYIDDETKEEVTWEQVLNYLEWGNYDGERTLEYSSSEPNETISPWGLGVEWLTGEGERTRTFVEGDYFTELLREHSHIEEAKLKIALEIKRGKNYGDISYSLRGAIGVWKYIVDYSTLFTGGLTGNLAVTYLGSHSIKWSLIKRNGNVFTVLFETTNNSTLESATRFPIFGYSSYWKSTVGNFMNSLVSSGAMSKTSQKIVWTEEITIK